MIPFKFYGTAELSPNIEKYNNKVNMSQKRRTALTFQ